MIDSTQNQYFEIRIKGHLSSERSRNFNGLELTELANGETLICGKFKDQAHLFGILIRVRDMGIPLLSVNRAGTETLPSKEFFR